MCELCKRGDKIMAEEIEKLRGRFQPLEEASERKVDSEGDPLVSFLAAQMVQWGVAEAVKDGVPPGKIIHLMMDMFRNGVMKARGVETYEGEAWAAKDTAITH